MPWHAFNLFICSSLIFAAAFPSFLVAQSSKARWIIGKNGTNGTNVELEQHKRHSASFEQKWGQSQLEGHVPEQQANNHPQLLNWEEWQKMREMKGNSSSDSSPKAFAGPLLIVAKAGDAPENLPAEAEELEEAENQWTEGWAHLERTLDGAQMPKINLARSAVPGENGSLASSTTTASSTITAGTVANAWTRTTAAEEDMASSRRTVDFAQFSNKFTTPTTPAPGTAPTPGGEGIFDMAKSSLSPLFTDQLSNGIATGDNPSGPSPLGQLSPLASAAQSAMDARQLPSLMLLLKQIPTVIRSFQEQHSAVSDGSLSERVGANTGAGGDIFPLATGGNGLLQQFLGTSGQSQQAQADRIQSRAVSDEYGTGLGAAPAHRQASLMNLADGDDDLEEEEEGNGRMPLDLPLNRPFHGSGSAEVQPAPIVPVLTTHGGRIDIRRLPLPSSNAIGKYSTVNGTFEQMAMAKASLRVDKEPMLKIGQKEKQQRLNIYGMSTVFPSSAYEAPLARPEAEEKGKKKPRPQFDIEKLTVGELGQLEKIHRKLLTGKEEEKEKHSKLEDEAGGRVEEARGQQQRPVSSISVKVNKQSANSMKLKQLPSSQAQKPASLPAQLKEMVLKGIELGQLDQSMLNDLLAVGELPDLEEMTSGMDLSLLHKPGGFAQLKQQFIERLIQRAISGGGGGSSSTSWRSTRKS